MADTQEVSTPEQETAKEPALETLLAEAIKAQEAKTEDPPSAPAPEKASGNPDEEKQKDPETPSPDLKEPPEHWSESDKTMFKSQSPEVQDYLLKRDKEMTADYTEKTTKLADARKFHDELSPILKDFEPQFRYHGVSAADGVRFLLNAQANLDRDPAAAIKSLAEMYKVDLKSIQPSDEHIVDPEVKELRDKLSRLEGQLTQNAQSQRNTQYSQAQKMVEDFKSEKDATGNPKYPYFDKVQEDMSRLINSGAAKDLPTAYDKAIRLNDELYGKTIKTREEQALKARDEEAKRQAEEAKKKLDGNIRGKNTPIPPKSPVTIEDNLRAAWK